jgi:hypothetical protein
MPGQPHALERRVHVLGDVGARQRRLLAQRERTFSRHVMESNSAPALKHHAVPLAHLVERAAAQAADVHAVHQDPAAVRAQQSDQVLEEDGLAAAAAADDDRDGAVRHLQVDAAQHRRAPE